eukprot:6742942-Pyramimonas_sp.AAC.1
MEAHSARLRAYERRLDRHPQRSRDTDDSARQKVDQIREDMTTWTKLLIDHTSDTTLHLQPTPGLSRPTAASAESPQASAGQQRCTSPGAASAAASAQTCHVSPVRTEPATDGVPIPSSPLSVVSVNNATPIKESDTVRVPGLPKITQP